MGANEELWTAYNWAMEHYGPEQVWADGEHSREDAMAWCLKRYREYHSPEAAQSRVDNKRTARRLLHDAGIEGVTVT